MAEGLLNYTRLDDPPDVICATQGRPLSEGDEVRLVDPLDGDVPEGEPGSLLTRGPYTPQYCDNHASPVNKLSQEAWHSWPS
jgi:2,3-dihydroxybenzoate-AMP ligase